MLAAIYDEDLDHIDAQKIANEGVTRQAAGVPTGMNAFPSGLGAGAGVSDPAFPPMS